jgi:hypothetical protein
VEDFCSILKGHRLQTVTDPSKSWQVPLTECEQVHQSPKGVLLAKYQENPMD